MGTGVTVSEEFTSTVPASRLFKAMVLDADNLLPRIAPQAFKSIETVEGDGGPGTIKRINFAEGGESKYMKHKIDALDEENKSYAYTLIEGDPLMDRLEKISYELKLESGPDGGTKGKNSSTYYVKAGVDIKEEEITEGKEKAAGVFKALEAYLLANPDVYA